MGQVEIALIPADEEPHFKEPERQSALMAFNEEMKRHGVKLEPFVYMQKSFDGPGSWQTGMFLLDIGKEAAPYFSNIITGLLGYLAAKKGRKVKVKVGNTEIEAGSPEEVKALLQILKDHSSKS
ncbi:hypothetical protein SAMN05216358_0055 [Rhizobium sp. AN5]|uniref:hypothetical protein n=1 Tax=Rhizobium sp. AN5 TaxID=1855304 RepID=UPI000BC5CFD0|nr:hypothetical protein [Rhizobium sp. AN5]SOC90036.1 hypothetical protein SAMN05216358_0055 [Rhizobium sp. AN5]